MPQPTEPQDQTTDANTAPTAQWLNIYESDSATVSVLLRDGYVTRLLVKTAETLPLSFAVNALKHWNTDDRRHFTLDPKQWVKTYHEGTQPQYLTTVETTFRDLEWTVIDTEPGITVSVVEAEQQVTHIRIDWSPEAHLEPEEAGTVCFADNALHDWNTVPGRQFQLDEERWQQEDYDNGLRFETTVQTTFQTVLELYIDTPEPLLQDSLVKTVVNLLSQQLPQYGIDYTSLFGSLQRVEHSPFARVTRTYVDNGEYFLEPEDGWATLPNPQVSVSLTVQGSPGYSEASGVQN